MKKTANNECSVTKQQIKLIHTLANKLKIEEDHYRQCLAETFGVPTSKSLTYSQAESVIRVFREQALAEGVWVACAGTKKHEKLGKRHGMASPAQLSYIDALWASVSRAIDGAARERGLRKFLDRTAKVSDRRFLTKAKATKVITILKQMNERQTKAETKQEEMRR